MAKEREKEWIGSDNKCDICQGQFHKREGVLLYDARTITGRWGVLCESCFKIYAGRLGTGFGQEYIRRDNKWVKIGG
jgi:hypothetical protein